MLTGPHTIDAHAVPFKSGPFIECKHYWVEDIYEDEIGEGPYMWVCLHCDETEEFSNEPEYL